MGRWGYTNLLSVLRKLLDGGVEVSWTWYFEWGSKVYKPRFFTAEEVKGLDPDLIAKLDWARGRSGVPFIITCGVRTPEENKAVGGVANSAHLRGLAVDLRCPDSGTRFQMVSALLLAGFKRVEIATAHIHVDLATDLPQNVMFLGVSA